MLKTGERRVRYYKTGTIVLHYIAEITAISSDTIVNVVILYFFPDNNFCPEKLGKEHMSLTLSNNAYYYQWYLLSGQDKPQEL